jgi:rubredoxin
VLDEEALQLKRYLVKNFDQNDISTEGLTFAVKTSPMTLFTSIVIEQKQSSRYAGNYDLVPSYQICYSKDFNPNTREYLVFAKDVEKEDLAPLLMELTKMYFEQLNNETETIISEKKPEIAAKKLVHQCSQCLTIYDEEYGDPAAGIALGVAFNNLPQDYLCPLCESTKKEFKVVEMVGEKETLRF